MSGPPHLSVNHEPPGEVDVSLSLSIGVMDVGGSHVHAALVRWHGGHAELTNRRLAPLDSSVSRDALLDQLAAPAAGLTASAWAVAMPGPFDYARGRGDFTNVGKFGSLAGVDLRAGLAGRLGVAIEEVRFLNDAVAYGLGEWAYLPERPDRFVCVTLGTGVGSAFLVSGVPVTQGRGVPPNGWAHLLTLHGGPLEDTVSTRAISADYARRTGSQADVRHIAESARAGDYSARAAIFTALHGLGLALAPCLADFGAQRLVVGGAISRSWDLLEEPLLEGLGAAGRAIPALAPSTLLDDAPLIGAAHWLSRLRFAPSPAPMP